MTEWKTSHRTLSIGPRPLLMGILNITPDSFSDGGQFLTPTHAIARALEIEAQGADLLDLGAESTRPGATPVPAQEEIERLRPVLEALARQIKIPISIDTTKSSVAAFALTHGAEIINDISGGRHDPELWPTIARHQAGYVLMHSRATPATMSLPENCHYDDIAAEVTAWLRDQTTRATTAGIALESIVCDPGIGFAKQAEQSLELLHRLAEVKVDRPLLIGVSRKSFLRKFTPPEALQAVTSAAEVAAALRGARIWRTHDIVAAKASIQLIPSAR